MRVYQFRHRRTSRGSIAQSAIRPESAEAIRLLKALGIKPVVMLTGDNRPTAEAIATLRDKKLGAWGKALTAPKIAFLFPGQGAQSVGMGKALYDSSPVFRDAVDACAELLRKPLACDLRQVIFADEARLNQTAFTQPALFTISYATAKWYESQGISPDAMLGHSLGELF